MGIRIVKLPDVGEGVAEAELVEWHVAVGQSVLEDQILAAVMTDKATVEIPSPVAGTVVALGGEVGATLAVGAELVRLEVPKDAPLGFHSLRMATRRGMSNLRLFCIDDLPQVIEGTANHTPSAAQEVSPPCVIVGRADAETTDYFKFRVSAGQRLSFEMLGRRLGSQFDPQLQLLDAGGRELPGAYSNADSMTNFGPPASSMAAA